MKNTKYSNDLIENYGVWLENPSATDSRSAWAQGGAYRCIHNNSVFQESNFGVRPVMEISKSRISY